ncbi:hypothetical protein BDR26DRAFT_879609 [Obelidium mucronatum]|nr:hypothetical protein BDR26DRAFT_879609 [Obelidium mucronatum]
MRVTAILALTTLAFAQNTTESESAAAAVTDATSGESSVGAGPTAAAAVGTDPASSLGALLASIPSCGQSCLIQMYPAIVAAGAAGASEEALTLQFLVGVCTDTSFDATYRACYTQGCSSASDLSQSGALTSVIPPVCAQIAAAASESPAVTAAVASATTTSGEVQATTLAQSQSQSASSAESAATSTATASARSATSATATATARSSTSSTSAARTSATTKTTTSAIVDKSVVTQKVTVAQTTQSGAASVASGFFAVLVVLLL